MMEACSSRSSPTNMGNKASTILSSSCGYEGFRRATQQSKDKALLKNSGNQFPGRSKASAFQVGFAHSSDPANQDSRVS